jgi:hypothetical protein
MDLFSYERLSQLEDVKVPTPKEVLEKVGGSLQCRE